MPHHANVRSEVCTVTILYTGATATGLRLIGSFFGSSLSNAFFDLQPNASAGIIKIDIYQNGP